jgi:hypothetical protein
MYGVPNSTDRSRRALRYAPDPLPTTFFGWIPPLLKIPDSEVLDKVGLDAAVVRQTAFQLL